MQRDLRVSVGHMRDNGGQQSRRHALGAAEANLPAGRVREKAHFIHGLPQLIEYVDSMSQQGPSILGWDKPFRTPVEEPHAERLLGFGNGFRYGRLRNA